jgi:transcriptional regulator with XRE-family HTH domain
MSRRKYGAEDFAFASEFGIRLDEAIDAQDLTRDDAADLLRIHRSMLFRYLGGKSIPGSKVLQRACEELGVAVDYRGIRIDADYFKGEKQPESSKSSPLQLELPMIRESLNSPNTQVSIRQRKGSRSDRLEIRMTVTLAARKRF